MVCEPLTFGPDKCHEEQNGTEEVAARDFFTEIWFHIENETKKHVKLYTIYF